MRPARGFFAASSASAAPAAAPGLYTAPRSRPAMPSFEFSTIVVVPHSPTHHDTLNIGVILYDPDGGVAFRKITDNWPEVRRRTGFRYNPGRDEATVQGPFTVKRGYLRDLVESQFRDSIVVTPPKILSHFAAHREALDWIYSAEVGLPPLGAEVDGWNGGTYALLDERIGRAGFPRECHSRNHEFGLGGRLAVRFPHVFLGGGKPHTALFAASLDAPDLPRIVMARLFEVHAIRRWSGLGPSFAMCTAQDEQDAAAAAVVPDVRDTLALLGRMGVDTVYRDGIDAMLQGIKRAVLPPGAGRGGASASEGGVPTRNDRA